MIDNLRSRFRLAAASAKQSLIHGVEHTVLSRPGQAFMRHAGKIGGLSFFAGDITYGLGHWQPALSFVISDVFWAWSDLAERQPETVLPKLPIGNQTRRALVATAPYAPRAAALAGLGGAILLPICAKMNHEDGIKSLLFSSSLIALQAASVIFEGPFNRMAKRASQSDNVLLRKVFTPLADHPLVTTSTADTMLGKGAMFYSGLYSPNPFKTAIACLLWGVGGNGGLIGKDNNVRNGYANLAAARYQALAGEAPDLARMRQKNAMACIVVDNLRRLGSGETTRPQADEIARELLTMFGSHDPIYDVVLGFAQKNRAAMNLPSLNMTTESFENEPGADGQNVDSVRTALPVVPA